LIDTVAGCDGHAWFVVVSPGRILPPNRQADNVLELAKQKNPDLLAKIGVLV
jgi:hypothetical protein